MPRMQQPDHNGVSLHAPLARDGTRILPRDLRRPVDTRTALAGTVYEYRAVASSGFVNGRGVKLFVR